MENNAAFYSFRERGDSRFQSFAMELVPGKKCQLDCASCFKRSALNLPGDMPEEFVSSALLQAKEAGFAEAVFIGGEPTLHPSLPRFVRQAIDLGLNPIICTNGIKLAESSYAEKLALAGVTIVMHAPLPSGVQDNFVGAAGYSKKLHAAYQNVLGKNNVKIIGEVVLVEEFLPYILDAYRWCEANGVIPFVEINRRGDSGAVYSGTATPEKVQQIFERLAEQDPSPPELLPPAYGQTCTMSITGLHVKNFGAGDHGGIYSCCAQGVRHGDLTKELLSEILQRKTLEVFQIQDEWIFGPCRNCPNYSDCRGGCRGEAYLSFGCPRASSPTCWKIAPIARNSPSIMAPSSCTGCPLQGNPACKPRG